MVCDLCSVACNRWLTDDLLDFMFTIMNAGTTSHHFQVISEPLMLSQSFRGVTAEYPATSKQCLRNGGYAATRLNG